MCWEAEGKREGGLAESASADSQKPSDVGGGGGSCANRARPRSYPPLPSPPPPMPLCRRFAKRPPPPSVAQCLKSGISKTVNIAACQTSTAVLS